MNDLNSNLIYAGFWNRFIAFIVDQIILGFVRIFFYITAGDFFNINHLFFEERKREFYVLNISFQEYDDPAVMFFSGLLFLLFTFGINAIIGWLYYATFESSEKMATPGKLTFGIKVTDMEGEKISFSKATGRYFGKYLSTLVVFVGFLMAAFTEKKQALHDILANCLIINHHINLKELNSNQFQEEKNCDNYVI